MATSSLSMLVGKPVQDVGKVTIISLSGITFDMDIQSRDGISDETVSDYASTFKQQDGYGEFPPIKLFFDGEQYWIGDGNHRYLGMRDAGFTEIPAIVRMGTRRDAILMAVGSNDTHGLRRSTRDKRRSVRLLLLDEEWREWSDRQIGDKCAVDHKTVGRIRSEMVASGEIPQIDKRTAERGGITYEIKPPTPPARPKQENRERWPASTPSLPTSPSPQLTVLPPPPVRQVPIADSVEYKTDNTGQLMFGVPEDDVKASVPTWPEGQSGYCYGCSEEHSHWAYSGTTDVVGKPNWTCEHCGVASSLDKMAHEAKKKAELAAQEAANNKDQRVHLSGMLLQLYTAWRVVEPMANELRQFIEESPDIHGPSARVFMACFMEMSEAQSQSQ